MLRFTFENAASFPRLFPRLFPRFAFDTPESFADYLIVFKRGIFSLREIRCGFQNDKPPNFTAPTQR